MVMDQTAIQTTTGPNWELARDLYVQQVPHRTIAERAGVSIHALRARAYRQRWAHEPNNDLLANPPNQQELVQEWLFNMSISILASSRWWSKQELEPSSMRESKDLESARQCHIQSGRMLFGLDREPGAMPVGWGKRDAAGPVIDVTPVPLPATTPKGP